MANLAAALEKEGISAFRFDFAGNGYAQMLKLIYEPLGYQNKWKGRAPVNFILLLLLISQLRFTQCRNDC